jgi:DNA-binding beta-propeller fold protein YncE
MSLSNVSSGVLKFPRSGGRASSVNRFFCGMVVLNLFFGVIGQGRSDLMYWTEPFPSGNIRRAKLDGTEQQILFRGLPAPTGIDLDLAGGLMYWANFGSGEIRRASLDGTGQTTLITRQVGPGGLVLDLVDGQMYWCNADGGNIRRANVDGSGMTTLVRGLNQPRNIALDLAGGLMYWTNHDSRDIRRANLDGSGQTILLQTGSGPNGIALDIAGGKLYWTEPDSGDIRRANLDGSGQELLLRGQSIAADLALDVAQGQMYWSNAGSGEIQRANLDGTGRQVVIAGLPGPHNIALDLRGPVPLLVTGYSADVITDKDPAARFAQPFHAATFAWFESGAVDDNGTPHNDGLPAGLTFLSATRSRATYQIQPANANNVLQLSAGQTDTLTLTTPTAYSTLYIMASSGDGTPSSVGSGTIDFADGSQQAFSYNCFDWCNGPGGLHPEAVLTGPNGRADVGLDGTAFVYNQDCDFQVYETVITIDPWHAGVAIASIDFTGAPDAVRSNIFGVSGQ